MARSVAFLRGINVGGHRVAKEQLIEVFTQLGFRDVETFLASGNVILGDGPSTTDEAMGDALDRALGYAVPTTVRTRPELESLGAAEPFPAERIDNAAGQPQLILLFDPLNTAGVAAVLDRSCADDLLVPVTRAVHWLPAHGVSGSGLAPKELDRLVGPNTVRSVNTIRRLVAKL